MVNLLKSKSTILTLFLLLFNISCSQEREETIQPTITALQFTTAHDLKFDEKGLSKISAVIKTTKGNIVFKFYPLIAPNTITRVIQLIQTGFYDGLTFHRVIPNFVIQGGDPKGDGTGGSGVKIKSEFSDKPHIIGTVAMARSSDPDSADSQFYIALTTLPHLDNQYTVFGQVVEGIDILSQIAPNENILAMTLTEE